MTHNTNQLEALVRRIVGEVLAGGNATTNNNVDSTRRLCLEDARVITVTDLDGRLEGIDEVVAGTGAVVTPAARDMLRSQGLEITRRASGNISPKAEKNKTIRIADTDSNDRGATFARQLGLRRGTAVDQVSTEDAMIVLADIPQTIVAKLCQTGNVAVQIGSLDEFQRVTAVLQPAVWVLDMKRLNIVSATNLAIRVIRVAK